MGKHVGFCNLCGERKELSRAHFPPRAARNIGTSRQVNFEWDLQPGAPGRVQQGGVWKRTLCRECNSLLGGFDRSYARIANGITDDLLVRFGGDVTTWPSARWLAFGADERFGSVARSVLGALVAGVKTQPGDGFDAARSYLLGAGPAPGGQLLVGLTASTYHFSGGPLVQVKLDGSREPVSTYHLSCTPLAWTYVTDGSMTSHTMADVTDWLTLDAAQKVRCERDLLLLLPDSAHDAALRFAYSAEYVAERLAR